MTIRPWIAATLGFLLAGCAATGGGTSGASSGTLRTSAMKASVLFSSHDRDTIREYYRPKGGKGLPPGLAKKKTCPRGCGSIS